MLDLCDLICRKQFTVDFINTNLCCHTLCRLIGIPGKHDGLFDAVLLQSGDRILRGRFYHIGDHDTSCIGAIHGNVADRSLFVLGRNRQIFTLHQAHVSNIDLLAVHPCTHTMSGDLLNVRDTGKIQFLSICLFQTQADRMGR